MDWVKDTHDYKASFLVIMDIYGFSIWIHGMSIKNTLSPNVCGYCQLPGSLDRTDGYIKAESFLHSRAGTLFFCPLDIELQDLLITKADFPHESLLICLYLCLYKSLVISMSICLLISISVSIFFSIVFNSLENANNWRDWANFFLPNFLVV